MSCMSRYFSICCRQLLVQRSVILSRYTPCDRLPELTTKIITPTHFVTYTMLEVLFQRSYRPGTARRYAPADGSSHISGGRPAAGSQRSLGWYRQTDRQTDGSRYRLNPPTAGGTCRMHSWHMATSTQASSTSTSTSTKCHMSGRW